MTLSSGFMPLPSLSISATEPTRSPRKVDYPMPVTRDDVRGAYRLLLGREPENEAVIDGFMHIPDIRALRERFIASREYLLGSSPTEHRIGDHYADPAQITEVEASPAERQAMFDRIGKAWAAYGETEPHWSVLTNDAFRQHNLAANIDVFYESGHADVGALLAFAARAGASPGPAAHALDFGCGVGRLTLAVAERVANVVGVDISMGHLRLARERASENGVDNVSFEQIRAVDDLARWQGTIDLVLSRIVLQHNPPPIMAALLEGLLRALAPGGVAVLQLPTFIPGQDFTIRDYLLNTQPQMEMNALPQRHVFEIIERTGCRALEVREDNSIGAYPGVSQTFAIRRG